MNMNKNILKGKWLEIKGRVKEKWGKLTNNDLGEIEGKNEKLLGLLRKKYGYIRDKAKLEYNDSVELAEIVSSIRGVMITKKNVIAIAFIARYGQPLLAKKRESQVREEKSGYDIAHYSDSHPRRRTAHLAPQNWGYYTTEGGNG